jgi:putative sterol carrier protein
MNIEYIFNDFAKAFERKIDSDYFIKLQFEIKDVKKNIWQVDVNNGKVIIHNGEKIIPEEVFILSKNTLLKLYNNELSPVSAFLNKPNEKGEMCSLIELKNKTEDKKIYYEKKPQEEYSKFLYRLHKFEDFFSKDYPTEIVIKKENCINYLKNDAIGLNFDFEKGVGQLFFSIKKEQYYKNLGMNLEVFMF